MIQKPDIEEDFVNHGVKMRAKSKQVKDRERQSRFRVRQLIRSIIDRSCYWDQEKREQINRISRTELLQELPVDGVDVGQVPRILKGEVLQDSRGEGSLQRGVFWR